MHKHGGDIYGHENVIDFSASINPLGMPKEVKNAALAAVENSVSYPDVNCRRLVEAISKMENVEKESIICGNGAAEIIFTLVFAVKPKRAIVAAPCFEEYRQALKAVDCQIESYCLKEENDFVPKSDILKMIDECVDMIFICNPNNPTGTLYDKSLLLEMAKRCKQCGVLLVIDECFLNFVDDGEKRSMKGEEGVFTLKAFTKMYAMAGLRLGYGICSDNELIGKMKECVQPWSVSTVAQEAGAVACSAVEHAQMTREFIKNEKIYMLKEMERLAKKIYGHAGNFIFFKDDVGLYEKLLKNGIKIRDCGNFTGLENGYYRVAVKGHSDNEKLMSSWQNIKEDKNG